MSFNVFDRVVINQREKPLSSDIGNLQSQFDRTIRQMFRMLYAPAVDPTQQGGDVGGFVSHPGFMGSSFRVRPASPASMTLTLDAGHGFALDPVSVPTAINGITGLDDRSSFKPIVLLANQSLTIPTADAANPRVDIVEVRYDRLVSDAQIRLVLNALTNEFVPTNVNKNLGWAVDGNTGTVASPSSSTAAISIKTGVPSATPAIPATTSGYIKIAEYLVPATATAVDYDRIKDTRRMMYPGGCGSVHVQFQHRGTPNPPNSIEVIAPPGVAVAIRRVTDNTGQVYVFAGDLYNGGTLAHASASGSASAQATEVVTSAAISNTSAGIATALVDAATTAPILKVASLNGTAGTGAPAIVVGYELLTSAGANSTPPVTSVSIDIAWRYR